MKSLVCILLVSSLTISFLLILHNVYYGDSQSTALDYWEDMPNIISQDLVKENVLYGADTITENDLEMSPNHLNKEDTPVVTKPSITSISSPVATTKPPTKPHMATNKPPIETTKPSVATTKSPVVPNPVVNNTHNLRPYTVCSSYWEQQSNAILNMFSLQRWANSLGITVVEPFVCQSELKFPPEININTLTNTLRLHDYIDLDYWNTQAKKAGIPALESWEKFSHYSVKKIILVILPYSGAGGTYANDKIKNHPQCNKAMSDFFDKHGKLFHSLQFQVVRSVCISFDHYIIPPETFNAGLQLENNKGATVWITEWQGVENGRVAFAGLGHNKFGRTFDGESTYLAMIKPSRRLLKDSQRYVSEVLGAKFNQFDAVVARNKPFGNGRTVEWNVHHFNDCVSQLEQHTKSVKIKMFLAIDMGRFGDLVSAKKFDYNSQGNYTGNGKYLYQRYLNVVYGSKSIDSYENDFVRVTNGIRDSGYIGALQRTVALHASHVFVVGGHSAFQRILIKQFDEQKKYDAVTKVCFN